jgi:hypothetical protein
MRDGSLRGPWSPCPEGQVEVWLVGRLVVGEAEVVGDAEQAAADPRFGVQPVRYPAAQFSAEGDDEPLGRFEQVLLVGAAVGVEVPLGVVAFQPGQKREASGAESAEDGGVGRCDWAGPRRGRVGVVAGFVEQALPAFSVGLRDGDPFPEHPSGWRERFTNAVGDELTDPRCG